jgi:hypothetical protein
MTAARDLLKLDDAKLATIVKQAEESLPEMLRI